MLAVVIPTLDDEECLALTLAALVPAAAEGVVREVVVVDGGSRDETLRIADAAGCVVVEAAGPVGHRLALGAATASRGDFLLFLKPGVILDRRWESEATAFAERVNRSGRAGERAATIRIVFDDPSAGARLRRLAGAAARRLGGLPHPAEPLLLSRRLYQRVGGHRPLAALEDVDLVRRIGRRRLVRLRAAAELVSRRGPFAETAPASRLRRRLVRALSALPLPAGLLARLHG